MLMNEVLLSTAVREVHPLLPSAGLMLAVRGLPQCLRAVLCHGHRPGTGCVAASSAPTLIDDISFHIYCSGACRSNSWTLICLFIHCYCCYGTSYFGQAQLYGHIWCMPVLHGSANCFLDISGRARHVTCLAAILLTARGSWHPLDTCKC